MNNQMEMFEGQHEIVILTKDEVDFNFHGDFLIRAKDVSSVLEYARTEEVTKFCKPGQVIIVKNNQISSSALNRIRKLNNTGEAFITNLALNRVLGKSEKPKAETFQDWLYEDMLPSVQKKGVYMTTSAIEKTLEDPDFIIRVATELKREKQKRIEYEQQLLHAAPQLAYLDIILQSKATVTTTQIAKDYGLTANELNEILKSQKIQYKVNNQWVLYKSYADKGYTQSHSFDFKHKDGTPDVKMNTRWTQRGRLFIHRILTDLGIKANLEKEFKDVK